MSASKVLLVCNQRVRDESLPPADLDRLSSMADWEWLPVEGGVAFGPNVVPDAIRQLIEHVGDVDCVVVSHDSPMISAEVMDGSPNLKIIGELEGDRFAYRIDVESAWERGIRTVDTTHGSSYPVAERALGHVPTSSRVRVGPSWSVRDTKEEGYGGCRLAASSAYTALRASRRRRLSAWKGVTTGSATRGRCRACQSP